MRSSGVAPQFAPHPMSCIDAGMVHVHLALSDDLVDFYMRGTYALEADLGSLRIKTNSGFVLLSNLEDTPSYVMSAMSSNPTLLYSLLPSLVPSSTV